MIGVVERRLLVNYRTDPQITARLLPARSTFFDDATRFPAGSATLDCALLMRDIPVAWNPLAPMAIGVNSHSA